MKIRIGTTLSLLLLALSGNALAQGPAPAAATAVSGVRSGALADFKTCAKPVYPKDALRDRHVGTVTLGFLIGKNGMVLDTKIDKSSGHIELDEAARDAIMLCHFKPATKDGEAQEAWTKMQYVWTLN
ncbi:MAG: energy transducer TonB [Massilia sp.]